MDSRPNLNQAGHSRQPGGSVSMQVREILRGSENYSSWAFATKMVLIKERTWCAIKEQAEGDPEVSEEISEQALATICLSIDSSIYGLVRDAKNAKEAWNNLRNTYEHSGSTRKIGLLRRLTGIRLAGAERDEDIICHTTQQYVNELFTTSHQLAEVGFKVDDTWLASLMMKGLPKQYEPMILGLESSGIKLTADVVKAKILQDVKISSELKPGGEAFFSHQHNQKPAPKLNNVKCYRCKKLGHYASQCSKEVTEKKKEKHSRNSGHAAFFAAFNARETYTTDEEEWFFDSGATVHLCRNRDLLTDAVEVSASINVANNAVAPVVAKGFVSILAATEGASCDISMSDVLCVPDLAINLLSVSRMCQKGYSVTFTKQECKVISSSNEVVAIGQETNGLYKLVRMKRESANLSCSTNSSLKLWHQRLCHLSVGNMKRLSGMVTGIEFSVADCEPCIPCIQGKHHRRPFNSKGCRADHVLELIHSDLCGPMETMSLGGSRYFLTFIDDASRKTFVYFLKSKTEVLEAFQDFKCFVENQTGEKIKRLRSDNGKEYINREMNRFLRRSGIKHETTVPYNPEQNGLAERMNRTIVERARSMLFDADLDKQFWAEAVATASYVVNRSPTKGLPITPEEKFSGRKPDLSHLRVFGTKVMFHVPKEKRRKWDAKSEAGIFMGYTDSSKVYRVYSSNSRNVVTSRDVIFLNESDMTREPESEKSSNEAELVELVIQPFDCDPEPESKPRIRFNNEDSDNASSSESEYDDANGEETVDGYEQQQQSGHSSALPPHTEDPCILVRRSERERIPTGKYRDYIMNCSAAPQNSSRFIDMQRGQRDSQDDNQESLIEPETFRQAISGRNRDQWREAMQLEFEALEKNNTWELTSLPDERKPLRCKWVYKIKTNSDGSVERFKARLVIKGYSQVQGVDYGETYAPVVRYATVRYLMSLAARMNLKVSQMDAVSAFLQGDLNGEEIFMEQPEGFINQAAPTEVYKLRKALYGLKQASRVWNLKLDAELKKIGLKRSMHDTCVYFKIEGTMILIVAVYVDDLLIFSNNESWEENLKKQLTKKFMMKDLGLANKVLGLRVTREDNATRLDQEQYINELLERFGTIDCNAVATPADPGQKLTKEMSPKSEEERKQMEKVPFRELVGGLQYLAQGTRPDISFAVNAVSHFCNDPGKAHWIAAKRILRYLKGTKSMKLTYNAEGEKDFVGYCDADWGNDIDTRRSITGYVFMQSGGPVSWNCRKQSTVALSTTEAEYMAVSAATQEAIWWKGFRKELSGRGEPVIIFCDNKSAIHLAEKEIGYSPRSKHIDIRHHFVRQHIEQQQICLKHVSAEYQAADMFTKALSSTKHEVGRKALGIRAILG